MKDIIKKLNKKRHYILLALILSIVSFSWLLGIRLTPLGALRSNFFIKGDIEVLENINVAGGKIYIIDTAETFKTVYIDRYGPFWVRQCAFHTEKALIEGDPLKMIGIMNYSKNVQEQVQLLGVWNDDPEVKAIQVIREDGLVYTKPAPISHLILFQWDKVENLSSMSILALDKDDNSIYYYGYPKGTNILRGSEFKWHPVIQN